MHQLTGARPLQPANSAPASPANATRRGVGVRLAHAALTQQRFGFADVADVADVAFARLLSVGGATGDVNVCNLQLILLEPL